MKEFIVKHPIITFLIVGVICGTVYDCAYLIKKGEAPKPGLKIDISDKGDEKED